MSEERLQKFLAASGVASRRQCEELIVEGAVEVNGEMITSLPAFVDPDNDVVKVNGKRVMPEQKVYFLLNKPKGVICTSKDPQGRKKAIDYVNVKERVFCVGRLDADTTGVIILTNDTKLANKLTHPRYELPKTYVAGVKGKVSPASLEKIKKGVWLSEGRTGKAAVKVLKRGHDEGLIEITISQGLNRQIRRMLAKVGLKVKSLKRTRIGKIDAKGLGVGKVRPLTHSEIAYLQKQAAR